MTWQTKFPDIAKGLDALQERKANGGKSIQEARRFTPEEQERRKANLREAFPLIYEKKFGKQVEPDWAAILKPKDPFRR
jgi:hypothetical protein